MAGAGIPIEQLRPLAHRFGAERAGELVLRSGEREIAIRGNIGFVTGVLSRCDGHRTVPEIAAELGVDAGEVSRLLAPLLERDLVTDCTLAWRNFHRQSSVGSRLFREPDEAAAAELGRRSAPAHERVLRELRPGRGSLQELTGRRRSAVPKGAAREIGFEDLCSVLAVMYGNPDRGARPVPSGGGLYPLLLHVLVPRPLTPLEPGLWWYEPDRGLWLVRAGELDTEGLFVSEPVTDELIGRGHPIVFISADLSRPSRRYANRGYRLALMEVGASMQNAYLMAAELGLPIRAFAGIVESEVDEFLEHSTHTRTFLAMLLGS